MLSQLCTLLVVAFQGLGPAVFGASPFPFAVFTCATVVPSVLHALPHELSLRMSYHPAFLVTTTPFALISSSSSRALYCAAGSFAFP